MNKVCFLYLPIKVDRSTINENHINRACPNVFAHGVIQFKVTSYPLEAYSCVNTFLVQFVGQSKNKCLTATKNAKVGRYNKYVHLSIKVMLFIYGFLRCVNNFRATAGQSQVTL